MMRTLVSDNGSTRPSIGQVLLVLLFKRLSKHMKRSFFISSLYGQFNHYAKQRALAVNKLNDAMRLVHREAAMELPMAMRGRVWGDTGLDQVLTESALVQAQTDDELRALARRVINIRHPWTTYASEEEMASDVADYLRNQRESLFQTTTCT